MTKLYLWLAVVGLLTILAISAYIFINRQEPRSATGKKTEIFLYVRSGDVSYKTKDMTSFERASSSPIVISDGSFVHTGVGEATILFPDNSSVDLDKYTEIEVNYVDKKVSLYQTLGSTYHRIETLVSGASYEVRTPGTLAAVRGTKFAVKYDKKTKVTKIAVTESIVQVAKQTESGTSTEVVMLEKGQTAKIDEIRKATSTESRGIVVVQTATETDMKEWTEKNQQVDMKLDSIKEETKGSDEVIRDVIKKTLLKDSVVEDVSPVNESEKKDAPPVVPEKNVQRERKTELTPEADKPKETKELTPDQVTAPTIRPTVKIDEEIFFDKFSDLFIRNFYLDEKDSTCSLIATPEQRVKTVSSYAEESGYPFTSATMLSFAREIDAYCKDKNPGVKTKLQGRFDQEFPFNEDI